MIKVNRQVRVIRSLFCRGGCLQIFPTALSAVAAQVNALRSIASLGVFFPRLEWNSCSTGSKRAFAGRSRLRDLESSYTINEHRRWHQPLSYCFKGDHFFYILLYDTVAVLANDTAATQRLGPSLAACQVFAIFCS